MAQAGRKPKNPQLKVLQGKPGHRPLPEVPDLRDLGAEPPEFLTSRAKQIWNRWAASLIGLGLFADIHKELLASTVQFWATYEECMEYVAENGIVDEARKRRHELITAENAFKAARAGMSELGLTPSELGRLRKSRTDGDEFFGY